MQSTKHNLEKEYLEHTVFERLEEYAKFYGSLGFQVMGWVNPGTGSMLNMDTYVFSSIRGTLDSIKAVLKMGQIGDAYALLRKYYDSTIINVYTNLLIETHFKMDDPTTFKVVAINNWLRGRQPIPDYREMFNYIQGSEKLDALTKLIRRTGEYKNIRERCNEYTHYNFYRHVLLNDKELHQDRLASINKFADDLDDIFVQHFIYIFYLKDNYLMSSDYTDYIDLGMTPPEDSKYWVSPPTQKIFNKFIKPKRPDLADELKNSTSMQLD